MKNAVKGLGYDRKPHDVNIPPCASHFLLYELLTQITLHSAMLRFSLENPTPILKSFLLSAA